MSLVEDSYYTHDEYGRVKLLQLTASRAAFMTTADHQVHVSGRAAFDAATEPAPVTIDAPTTDINAATNTPD